MSEHPPQNQNLDKAPKFSKERVPYSTEDESLAHYIHNETGGQGASSEHVDELIDVANEKIDAKRDSHLDNQDSPELDPGGESEQEQATELARADVEKALKDQESDVEDDDDEAGQDFKGNDDETKLMNGLVENEPKPGLGAEDISLYEQIDAIDSIRNYKQRTKKLREFALLHNGQLDSMGIDIGVEAAKRLDTSHARSVLNPRRYTLKLGSARRQYNGLLAEMAKGGPNGANLTAALAMKRNWDPRYIKNVHVPGKNEAIYNVAVILERQIEDIPGKIEEASQELNDLQEEESPDHKKIDSKREEIEKLYLKYDYSVEKADNIERFIDPLFMSSRKYYGEVVANRAIMKKDFAVLEKINKFIYKKQREQAISKILIKKVGDFSEDQGQSLEEYKTSLIKYAKENISSKKIRDATIKQIA